MREEGKKYIRQSISRGVSPEKIRQDMIGWGYDAKETESEITAEYYSGDNSSNEKDLFSKMKKGGGGPGNLISVIETLVIGFTLIYLCLPFLMLSFSIGSLLNIFFIGCIIYALTKFGKFHAFLVSIIVLGFYLFMIVVTLAILGMLIGSFT